MVHAKAGGCACLSKIDAVPTKSDCHSTISTHESKVSRCSCCFDCHLKSGCSFFRPRNVFFQTARLVHFVFGRSMSFFRPAAFLQPRNDAWTKTQSFFQPLYTILSCLFLGLETSCSEPGFFWNPERSFSFLDLQGLFSTSVGETGIHKARRKANCKPGI